MPTQRLYFIDMVRAYAILMMLQGHFIDAFLAVEYRDISQVAYRVWLYLRGITAPTFFTISGLIFTYLLLRAKKKGKEAQRMRKGLNRGLMLIGIGYVLRIPFFSWLVGDFNCYVLVVDVLQVIGVSLIVIVGLYLLCYKNNMVFSILNLGIGFSIFVCEPLYRSMSIDYLPQVFSNYLTKANGSIFTFLPWFGYMAFGAYIACLFNRYLNEINFKPSALSLFLITGYLFMEWSSLGLFYLKQWTGIQLFLDAASYNYLFTRLGNVFIYFAIFYALDNYFKPPLLLKIGQKTLSIYVIHFVIIYGSFTGFGLNTIIGKILTPWQAVLGAIMFLIIVCFISFYYVKTNAYMYMQIRRFLNKD